VRKRRARPKVMVTCDGNVTPMLMQAKDNAPGQLISFTASLPRFRIFNVVDG